MLTSRASVLGAALVVLAAELGAQQPAPFTPGQVPGAPMPGSQTPGAPGTPGQQPARDRRPGENARGTAIIRGQVTAADTGAPLRRAQIRVSSQSPGGSMAIAQTDAQGRFEVTELAAGRYGVTVSRSGYVTMQFGQKAPNQGGTPIEIADGQAVDKVNFALPRGGAISGRIVDDLGEPVASVNVSLRRYAYQGGTRRMIPAGGEGANARTDDLGQFRLFGLPPGEYYVSATLRTMDFAPMNASSNASTAEGFAPTYFPGTSSVAEARRVTVRAGQDVHNISFALIAARLARISGRITMSNGEPMSAGMMMIAPRAEAGGMGFTFSGAQIRPDGTFQTGGIAPGSYSLIVQPNNSAAPGGEVGRVDVEVQGDDLRDVFIVMGRGGVIRGRIVSDDGSPLPFRPAQVRVFAMPREPGEMPMSVRPPVVNDDWTFEMGGLTNGIRLSASVMPGTSEAATWTVRHAWSDNVDLLDDGIEIGPGRTLEGIEIVFTNKVTELTGLVGDSRNQPVSDAQVVVFPDDKARWTNGMRYLRLVRPDTNGKYSVRLTPHDGYRAVVVRGLEDGQFADPEFLTRALEYATPFRIAEGETKTLNLRLTEVR